MANGESEELEQTGSFGLLQINTYLQNIGFPLKGVTVTISESDSGTLLTELQTDEEGKLPPVRLPSPPESYAQSPDEPRPFSQYDVRAQADGFEEAYISNVPLPYRIFS